LVVNRGIPGYIVAPRPSGHSRKPDQQYDIAEAMVPGGPYLELFARGDIRPGWNAWGDEVNPDQRLSAGG